MKFFTFTKNNIALLLVTLITIIFFTAGLFNVLDNVMLSAVLFLCYGALLVAALYFALVVNKKNRPEDAPQDDSL